MSGLVLAENSWQDVCWNEWMDWDVVQTRMWKVTQWHVHINDAYTSTSHINSVSHLAEILKQAIENEQQLLQEIKMPYKELQIDMVGIL